MKAQYFHYAILQTFPLNELEKHKEHRRLKVFYHKGCKCVECGIEGTLLALGKDRGGLHLDVYTDDFYPLTVDHIIPKSKGGSNELDNLQPMCCLCNWKKGNGDKPGQIRNKYPVKKQKVSSNEFKNSLLLLNNEQLKIGDFVYRRNGKKIKELGYISKFLINPFSKHESIMIQGNDVSMYSLKSIYIKYDSTRTNQTSTIRNI